MHYERAETQGELGRKACSMRVALSEGCSPMALMASRTEQDKEV